MPAEHSDYVSNLYFLLWRNVWKTIIFRRRLTKPLWLCARNISINGDESRERTRTVRNLVIHVTHVTHVTVPASLILLLSLPLSVRWEALWEPAGLPWRVPGRKWCWSRAVPPASAWGWPWCWPRTHRSASTVGASRRAPGEPSGICLPALFTIKQLQLIELINLL